MKRTLIYVSLFLFCSCTIKKLQVPTTAIDINTGAEIMEKSIQLEKGKIVYIYSTQYKDQLSDRSLLQHTKFSSFSASHSPSTDGRFYGWGGRSSEADTVIHNDLIVQMALQEALMNTPLGFQYEDVAQHEFTDKSGALNTLIVKERFDPDIIVNLKSLHLKISGDTHTGYSNILRGPIGTSDESYYYTTMIANAHGNILMDYMAIWEIQDIKGNTNQNVRQEGRYVSTYNKDYSENVEMMTCAKKIGREFSNLFKNSYRHTL